TAGGRKPGRTRGESWARDPRHPRRGELAEVHRREEAGLLPALRGLLVSVGAAEERRLPPGAAEEGDPDGEPVERAGGHGDVGVAGHGGGGGGAPGEVVAVHQVAEPGGAPGGGDQRVEGVGAEGGVDALVARELAAGGEGLAVGRGVEPPLGGGLLEILLA